MSREPDIVKRLRACHGIQSGDPECCCADAADEIERLKAENADLRRWKALDKPITAAMNIVANDTQHLRAEVELLRAALTEIDWKSKCDIAAEIAQRTMEPKP